MSCQKRRAQQQQQQQLQQLQQLQQQQHSAGCGSPRSHALAVVVILIVVASGTSSWNSTSRGSSKGKQVILDNVASKHGMFSSIMVLQHVM